MTVVFSGGARGSLGSVDAQRVQRGIKGDRVNDQRSSLFGKIVKFVKGLDGSGCEIYRKSGTWSKFHADGALVDHGDKKYIAVALMEDEHGGEIFPKLITKMAALITAPESVFQSRLQ